MSEKTWTWTKTGFVYHSFSNGEHADCRKNVRPGYTDLTDRVDAETSAHTVPSISMCKRCVQLDDEAQAEASVEPVKEADMDAAHAEALEMNEAETLAVETGIVVGSTWGPNQHNYRRHEIRNVTIRWVSRDKDTDTTWVGITLHHFADWRGRPYDTESVIMAGTLKHMYEPYMKPTSNQGTTYEVIISYTLPGSERERTWFMRVTPDAPSTSAPYKAISLAEHDFASSGPRNAKTVSVKVHPLTTS